MARGRGGGGRIGGGRSRGFGGGRSHGFGGGRSHGIGHRGHHHIGFGHRSHFHHGFGHRHHYHRYHGWRYHGFRVRYYGGSSDMSLTINPYIDNPNVVTLYWNYDLHGFEDTDPGWTKMTSEGYDPTPAKRVIAELHALRDSMNFKDEPDIPNICVFIICIIFVIPFFFLLCYLIAKQTAWQEEVEEFRKRSREIISRHNPTLTQQARYSFEAGTNYPTWLFIHLVRSNPPVNNAQMVVVNPPQLVVVNQPPQMMMNQPPQMIMMNNRPQMMMNPPPQQIMMMNQPQMMMNQPQMAMNNPPQMMATNPVMTQNIQMAKM